MRREGLAAEGGRVAARLHCLSRLPDDRLRLYGSTLRCTRFLIFAADITAPDGGDMVEVCELVVSWLVGSGRRNAQCRRGGCGGSQMEHSSTPDRSD